MVYTFSMNFECDLLGGNGEVEMAGGEEGRK